LRGIKYLGLLFFLWAVLAGMNAARLEEFVYGPYNRAADIKMLKFFTEMSATTFWVLVVLVLSSVFIPFSWCRYLCPYGAFLGALSWFSPWKINRSKKTCTACGSCAAACPSRIRVDEKKAVFSDECHACFRCIDACPEEGALGFSISSKRGRFPRPLYAGVIVLFFLAGTFVGRVTGYWQNEISVEEYRYHVHHLENPEYGHPGEDDLIDSEEEKGGM